MALTYAQLAQARENSTNAVSIYSPGAGETVQVLLKIANTSGAAALVRVFHDNDGTTYDERTALVWDFSLDAGLFLPVGGIFMNNAAGNLAYRSSVANALTATVYGIVKT